MIEYKCLKCHKIFNHKHNYLYHINIRKKDCIQINNLVKDKISHIISKNIDDVSTSIPIEEINPSIPIHISDNDSYPIYNSYFNDPTCVYCGKLFMNNKNRNRHMNNNCMVRKHYIDKLKFLDNEIEKYYLENKFLKNKFLSLFGDQSVFAFGTEKFNSYSKDLIIDCIKNPIKSIPDFIQSFHFNSLENRYNNVRIKNPRGLLLEVYNGVDWVIESKENVIQTLLRTYKDIIDMEVESYHGKIPAIFIKNYCDFSEYVDIYLSYLIYDREIDSMHKKSAKSTYTKIYKAIELMIINTFRKDITCKIDEENIKNKTVIVEE